MTQSNINKPVEKSTGLSNRYINDHIAEVMKIDKEIKNNIKK
jgi:hypothetical protein